MKELELARGLALPVDLATETIFVCGKRGSGKTSTAVRLAEQLWHAKVPFVALDPVDVWWGLKASRSGRSGGLGVYVFGGSHADLPLEPTAGAVMAEVVIEHRISAVLSLKHFTVGERARFVTDFAKRLYQRNREPIHIFLEEAHEVAPQTPEKKQPGDIGDERQMVGAVTRMWKLGRSSGIGGSAVTQRPASLSKNITEMAEILVVHRTIGPRDVAAVKGWIRYHGESEEILGQLGSLKTGEAFIWAPAWPPAEPLGLRRIRVRQRETFDSSATPKVGERRTEPAGLAPVQLERLRDRMAATIERAKAEDPRELQKRVRALERDLVKARAESPPPSPELIERARGEGRAEGQRESGQHVAELEQELRESTARMSARQAAIVRVLEPLTPGLEKALDLAREPIEVEIPAAAAAAVHVSAPQMRREKVNTVQTSAPRAAPAGEPAQGVSRPQQRILDELARLEGFGIQKPSRTQLALWCEVSPKSGGYFNNLSRMRVEGMIDYPESGYVTLTETGRATAHRPAPLSVEQMQDAVCARVGAPKAALLRALIAVYPQPMTRDVLADEAGVSRSSGGYFNNLGALRTLGLIDYPRPGSVNAEPVLFLEG